EVEVVLRSGLPEFTLSEHHARHNEQGRDHSGGTHGTCHRHETLLHHNRSFVVREGRYGRAGVGSFPPPPTALKTCPSANCTWMMLPTGLPLLTGRTVTVTSSPTLKLCLVQPRFCMSGGLLASTTQCTGWPSSPLTSNCRNVCGLAQ